MFSDTDKLIRRKKYLSDNVARFFVGPQGAAALKGLEELYCTSQLFDPDPVIMARNVAEHDLIRELQRVVKENHNE